MLSSTDQSTFPLPSSNQQCRSSMVAKPSNLVNTRLHYRTLQLLDVFLVVLVDHSTKTLYPSTSLQAALVINMVTYLLQLQYRPLLL